MAEITNADPVSPTSTPWLTVMARLYDPFFWLGEMAGMRRRRRELLRDAYGCVVEIGAGTGLNLGHYPEDVDELILCEPEPSMRRRLDRRLRGHVGRVVDAPAESLPLPDDSVDTVVSTMVLCTVGAPEEALREIARVLRPGGTLLFIEHVRADSRVLAAWQDRLREPWRRFAGGCICNRATIDTLRACGFDVDADTAVWRGMPGIVHPLAMGRAIPPNR